MKVKRNETDCTLVPQQHFSFLYIMAMYESTEVNNVKRCVSDAVSPLAATSLFRIADIMEPAPAHQLLDVLNGNAAF